MKAHLPSRSYFQPWYLQANCRQVPLISSAGWSVHTSLLPRWRQTLWKARTLSSVPRTMINEVRATTSSLVKKLPLRRSCSTRPTFSQARLKMASRSSSWNSGEIELSYDTGAVPSSGWCSVQVPSGGFGYCFGARLGDCMPIAPPCRSQDHAAVDADHLAGDEARFMRAQKPARRCHLLGGTRPADGDDAGDHFLDVADVSPGLGATQHRRVDHARRDAVDRDPVGSQLEREGPGEADHAGLRRDVVRHARGARLRARRRDRHHPAPAGRHHVGSRGLEAMERPGQIDGDCALPALHRDVREGIERVEAGSGDHDPDGSELRAHLVESSVDGSAVGDVDLHGDGGGSGLAQ